MGLDLLPRSSAPGSRDYPLGMIQPTSESCTFKDDKNPIGVFGTCCSFRGNGLALYLIALGLGPLAVRLFEDKLPEEALEFASELRAVVKQVREFMLAAGTKSGNPSMSLND